MTKGQVEAKISELVCKFEIEYMGRGPQRIKTTINEDVIIIRLIGFLSTGEKKLVQTKEGAELLKRSRYALFDISKHNLKEMIQDVISIEILSIYSDIDTSTGEKIIIITLKENYDKYLK